ncbi:unnamed protein product [Closterium sp. Naga37s-1]|nr:unnamed protein product [Closterium sp. Naga37s-1]
MFPPFSHRVLFLFHPSPSAILLEVMLASPLPSPYLHFLPATTPHTFLFLLPASPKHAALSPPLLFPFLLLLCCLTHAAISPPLPSLFLIPSLSLGPIHPRSIDVHPWPHCLYRYMAQWWYFSDIRDGTAAALSITQLGGPVAQWWDVGDIRDGHACIPSAHVPPAVPPLSLSQLSGPVAQWWDVGDIRDGHACIPSAHVPPAVPPLSLSQLSGPVAQWWDVGDIRALRMQWCYQWLPQLLCSQLSPLPLALLAIIHPTGPYLSG